MDCVAYCTATQVFPILRSGLSSCVLRTNMIEPVAIFHRKTLRGILNLSKYSTTPTIYFLLGELSIEGKIYRDIFSLFYSIWMNAESKIFMITKSLGNNSRTWVAHVRHLSKLYNLPDPLECLKI